MFYRQHKYFSVILTFREHFYYTEENICAHYHYYAFYYLFHIK